MLRSGTCAKEGAWPRAAFAGATAANRRGTARAGTIGRAIVPLRIGVPVVAASWSLRYGRGAPRRGTTTAVTAMETAAECCIVLAVDVGTTAVKVAAVDAAGSLVASSTKCYPSGTLCGNDGWV